MSKVDWSSMTAAEKYEAVSTAPRVAGAWIGSEKNAANRRMASRLDAYGGGTSCIARVYEFQGVLWYILDQPWKEAASFDEAKAAADAALVAAGWEVV